MWDEDYEEEIEQEKYRLLILTGAGISKASGIPTFDEVSDLRDKLYRSYAISHKEDFDKTIAQFVEMIKDKEPNQAHYAIAKYPSVPIITMNIDGLHQKAGDNKVIELHGNISTKIVLYGDDAPMYKVAKDMVKNLEYSNSYFVIIGTSFATTISEQLLRLAHQRKANVFMINDNAETRVEKIMSNISKVLGI